MNWISAIVSGLVKPLFDYFFLNKQVDARIDEKARADTAQSVNKSETAAVETEADMRKAMDDAKKADSGPSNW